MKVYVVSQGNEEFHEVHSPVHTDWNLAMKYCIEELDAEETIRDNKRVYQSNTVWEFWHSNAQLGDCGLLTRVTQLDLS